MQFKLYKTQSPKNKIDKVLTDELVIEGTLRTEIDILNPVILIESEVDISNYNYVSIPEFNRFYFVVKPDLVRNKLYRFTLKCDPLKSYAAEIKKLSVVVRRQESLVNSYINDNYFMTYNYDRVQTKLFPKGFSNVFKFVLTTTGTGGGK